MSETLDPVATTDLDHRQLAEQLLAQAKEQGVDLVGPNGLLNQLTKNVLETALDAEMAEHLGYDKHDPVGRGSGNSRNGVRSKTVLTEIGPVDIDVPRDVNSSFEPQIVKKRQRRLTGIDEIVLSLTAKGLTTGEIAAHFQDIYGATVSKDTISRITDKVVAEMAEWCNRPLEPGRFLAVVANQTMTCRGIHRAMISAGARSSRTIRGRALISSETKRRRSSLTRSRLVPFGKYCRRSPLVFSLVPRCQGECGSAK
jgi:putative transposase